MFLENVASYMKNHIDATFNNQYATLKDCKHIIDFDSPLEGVRGWSWVALSLLQSSAPEV